MNVKTGTVSAEGGAVISYTLREPDHKPAAWIALIHALAMDRSNWDDVVAALPPTYAVLTIDCRGHGASTRGVVPFSLELLARDLASVMAGIGWDSATVAGCSMGGGVAQAFAINHAERTDALLLIDTTAWYGPEAKTNWNARAERARTEGFGAMADFQVDRWFSPEFREVHSQKVDKPLAVFLANDVKAYGATCEMLGTADLRDGIRNIRCPTTIVVGRDDYATPVSAATLLNEIIPDSRLTILEGARHFTPIERPEDIAAALVDLNTRTRAEHI